MLQVEGVQTPGTDPRFARIWRQHERYLFHLCLNRLKSPDAVDEAMSRIAIKAWRKSFDYCSEPQPRALLRRIALNVCIDLLRERVRLRQRYIELDALPADSAWLVGPELETPGARLAQHELVKLLLHWLEDLPGRSRACARLAFIEQLSYKEIAERLALSPANVRKIIERVRKLLRPRLVETGVIHDEAGLLRQRTRLRKEQEPRRG